MMMYYGCGTKTKTNMTDSGMIMTTRVGSGIDLVLATQYCGSIENDKGVAENVETVNPENIVSIRKDKSDILSREGITRWFYSGMQSCMLSHRSESFNSGMSLKWKAWICVRYVYK